MSKHTTRVPAAAWAVAALLCAGTAIAQGAAEDPVLVENGPVKLHRSEYEAELLKLPPDVRPGFANSERRIADLVSRLVVQKTLAAQAEAERLGEQPQNAVRVRLEHERVLAQLRIAEAEERAGREFDARRDRFEARAREIYVADRPKYETPEQVSASHILFDLRKHSKEEGQKLAAAARARVLAGTDFNTVAKEVSEDPSAGMNSGHLGWFGRSDMDAAFAGAAFALRAPGDVSEPVLSTFGWHVIRLEERRPARLKPFEEVHDLIMADLRKRYIDDQRDSLIASIRDDPAQKPNRAAIEALYQPRPSADLLRNAMPAAGAAAEPAQAGQPGDSRRPLGTPPAALRGAPGR